jgi:hypothetical protein
MQQVTFNHFNPHAFNNYVPAVVDKTRDNVLDTLLVLGAIGIAIYIIHNMEKKPKVKIVHPKYKE